MDAHSEARLIEVHPTLADKVRKMAVFLSVEWPAGTELRVTQGIRTWANQHALYLQGRADLTDVNACRLNCGLAPIPADMNKRVTNADAGQSWHNFGLACDVAPFRDGFPVWDEKDPTWPRIVAVGESLGLQSGISYRDEPHFEWVCQYPAAEPTNEVRALYEKGGIQAVWDSLQA